MGKPTFHVFWDEAPDVENLCHVTIEYQTQGGSPGAWSRWVHGAADLTTALNVASAHVARFKRVNRIYGGSASPYRKDQQP